MTEPIHSLAGQVLRVATQMSESRPSPATRVDLVDQFGPPVHFAQKVYVNGSEVLVAKDGVSVELSAGKPTVVTLRLLPDEVHFRSENN